jgi:hypothetical protein
MRAAVSYGRDVALDGQRHAPWRDASHIPQAAETPRRLAGVWRVVSLIPGYASSDVPRTHYGT